MSFLSEPVWLSLPGCSQSSTLQISELPLRLQASWMLNSESRGSWSVPWVPELAPQLAAGFGPFFPLPQTQEGRKSH